MSTQAQKNKYGGKGNELLFPLALGGDQDALAILADRGNEVVDGKLSKERIREYVDQHGMIHEYREVVVNGKMVEQSVDGVAITGNILPFA